MLQMLQQIVAAPMRGATRFLQLVCSDAMHSDFQWLFRDKLQKTSSSYSVIPALYSV